MKVIISEDTKGLGKKFEIKEVKDGYAKNFLIPKKLVKAATEVNLKDLARQKSIWETKEKEIIEHLKKIATQLEDVALDFSLKVGLPAGRHGLPAQAGEKVTVFGSITALEIEKALKDLGIFQKFSKEIKKVEVLLEKPIKELGDYFVEIDLGKGIKPKIKIKVHSQP